jgi:predicted ATPase/DNA-binding SARP family transcriptional activator
VDSTLSIKLLGSPSIALDGQPVRGFVSSKAAALVYYLAATGRPHTRQALAGLLWPEVPDAQALKNLRDVLSNVRRLLLPYLQITRQTVALASTAAEQLDCQQFEARLNYAEQAPGDGVLLLQDAVALYQGDFLDGFSLPDAPAFEEWALVERERLRQVFLTSLHRLAVLGGQQLAYADALAYATRLLALDPTREETHRLLMLLLASSGQRSAALAQYQTCRRQLNDELGIDPDQATEALLRRILDGEVVGEMPAPPTAVRPIYQVPASLGPFIGRARELAQVVGLLRECECRLLTIVGTGGAGKTSLALQAARQLLPLSQRGEAFVHGVAFVPLAGLEATGRGEAAARPAMYSALAGQVADALHFTFSGEEAPHLQVLNYLREKDLLLVLDNCEHLPPLADFVVELLQHSPQLTILATSRVRLNLHGEQIIELDGLPFPSSRQPIHADLADKQIKDTVGAQSPSTPILRPPRRSVEELEQYDALRLFRRSAQAANPRFAWTPATVRAAAGICELVDGLPLGIELAASLVRLLPCEEVARELESNLGLLQSSRRDMPERHQSLRAVFTHSWKLLSTAEQRVLAQLSVFRGGFSREAATQVAGASLALLASLVDHSLVRPLAAPTEGIGRYQLQELVRQYAAEHLAAVEQHEGLSQPSLYERHCQYYLKFLAQRTAALRGRGQQTALAEIHQELDNIRAAWRWGVERGNAALVGPACDGLFQVYEMRSFFQEGVEVFAQAARRFAGAAEPEAQVAWGKLLAGQGWFAFQVGRQAEARELLEQSLAVLRPLAGKAELVSPLNHLAAVTYYAGDYVEANRLVDEALKVSTAYGDSYGMAVAKTILGQIAYLVGEYEDARRYSRESLAIERELGNRWGTVFPLISLGRVAQALGEYEEARRYFEEGLAIREGLNDLRGVALCVNQLGDIATALGEHNQARWRYQESLGLFKEIGNRAGVATSLTRLGYNALAVQDVRAAHGYLFAALHTAWETGAVPRILEALAGLATVLAGDEPERARELAVVVWTHPAVTQESRDRVAKLLERAATLVARGTCGAVVQQAVPQLEDVVRLLFAEE